MALKLKKKAKAKKIIKKVRASRKTPVQSVRETESNLVYPTGKYTEAVGRRKVATARVRLYKVKGKNQDNFIVNDQLVSEYFDAVPRANARYNLPFNLTDTRGDFAVTAKVSGSGISSQLDAVVHGIARALNAYDPDNRPTLKKAGLLTRDDRMKETRKIGRGGKARRKRQSPKR